MPPFEPLCMGLVKRHETQIPIRPKCHSAPTVIQYGVTKASTTM